MEIGIGKCITIVIRQNFIENFQENNNQALVI